ncbi:MAG: hypothetical protein AAF849_07875 [Bacteroidota bacterium]
MKKQHHWDYHDRFGKKYQIGIYHGASGHLVIYCNSTIITIDFNVLQPKTYTFYIGEELFNLSIKKEANDFAYDCQIDKDAPTYKNQARKAEAKEDLQRMLWASGLILVLVVLVFLLRS